jgi:hypothetical protein
MNSDLKKRLSELFTAHAAQTLDPAEHKELQTHLRNNEEARHWWFVHQDVEIGLRAHVAAERLAAPEARARVASPWLSWRPLTAAAALIFLGVVSGRFVVAREDRFVELVETQEARWDGSTLPTEAGSKLGTGRLRLSEGLARLRFSSGAEVTLEGPVELELFNPLLCRLHRGSLVAHVPETAHGFSVLTASARVIDHGTDFGISSDSIGNARVNVMRGEIELRHSSGAKPVRLATREMAEITPNRVLPVARMEDEPRNLNSALASPPYAAEITTHSGDGRSAFVSEVPGEGGDQAPILLLKNSLHERGFGRKVLLRFDLSAFSDPQSLTEARLTFNLVPTGSGYASRANEARIVAYAMTDPTESSWHPKNLKWSSQPAFHANAGNVDESRAVRVGEVVVPRGVQSGAFSIRSTRLSEIIRSAGNRPLTIILVRENPIEHESGLVLGIAGNRHPTVHPPTLSVR